MQLPQTAKILFIDDDKLVRRSVKDYFEDNGFTLIEAENGKQGLELFKKEKPDIVVTDLQMPVLGGLEVLKTLTKEFPEVPVVVISEPEGLDDVIQALRIGAWDCLTKPIVRLSVLEHAACRALERSRLIEENRVYRLEIERANQALKKSLDILEQDQEAGRSVQMRLLPAREISFGEYHFSYHVEPSLYLSGDFVDYFKINDHEFGLYIADVSGHGASSAFVTVLLKSIMGQALGRYQAGQDNVILEPDKLLTKIGEEIHSARLNKYLTAIYGVVNLVENQFTYCVGGHYPNPILLEGGRARFLEGSGFPVGIMQRAMYSIFTTKLAHNMKLLMFSDGVIEMLPEKDMENKEKRLLSMVEEGQGAIQHFIEKLGLKHKKSLPDDVTIFSLKRVEN
jgi:serine phosphatase RsbU (regulator of sigma subunit)